MALGLSAIGNQSALGSAIGSTVPLGSYTSMLTIEDGTIVAGADSYISTTDLGTYSTRLGITLGGTSLEREQAILRAMVFIEDHAYRFCGTPTDASQELSFPRENVPTGKGGYYGANEVPKVLKDALCEAAILELNTPGTLLNSERTESGKLVYDRKKVDVLETEKRYDVSSAMRSDDPARFERLTAFLSKLTKRVTGVRLVRA